MQICKYYYVNHICKTYVYIYIYLSFFWICLEVFSLIFCLQALPCKLFRPGPSWESRSPSRPKRADGRRTWWKTPRPATKCPPQKKWVTSGEISIFYLSFLFLCHLCMFYTYLYVLCEKSCENHVKNMRYRKNTSFTSIFCSQFCVLFSSMFACLLLFLLQSFAMQCSSCAFCLRLPFAYPGAPVASAFSVYGSIFRLRISLAT